MALAFRVDIYNHAMIFSAANIYSGPTIIGDGPQVWLAGNGSISHSSLIFFGGSNPSSVHMDVTGRSDQTLTLASGQTLAGIGAINGKLVSLGRRNHFTRRNKYDHWYYNRCQQHRHDRGEQ